MTWSAVGVAHNALSSSLTLANQAIGNLLIAEVINYANNTVWCTGFTGGGATWALAGVKFAGTTNTMYATVFFGTVTATGAQTAAPTWSGTAPSWISTAQEFHSTAGSWSLDGTQGNLDSAFTTDFVSLTPSGGAGELYFGYTADTGVPTAGTTTGYVYANDGSDNSIAYNVACPNAATYPVWGNAVCQFGIMVLVKEAVSGFSAPAAVATGQGTVPPAWTSPHVLIAGPAYASAAADLGGGSGSWSGTSYATGGP